MPMTAQLRLMLGNNDKVAYPGFDVPAATRTGIGLAGLIRLDDVDHQWVMVPAIHQRPPR